MNFDKNKIAEQAAKYGFTAVWVPVSEIPVNSEYLKYCEENRCGNYNANHACPPDCGTPEVLSSKAEHGAAIRRFRDDLRRDGFDVFAVGYGACSLCKPCKRKNGEPCAFPDLRVSCMSAYCVDVAKLAKRCALPFDWNPKKLYLFGMILFRKSEK